MIQSEGVSGLCGCHQCVIARDKEKPLLVREYGTRMILCPTCGNKRCPHANDHRNACTDSNEPGQPGSAYPDSKRATA